MSQREFRLATGQYIRLRLGVRPSGDAVIIFKIKKIDGDHVTVTGSLEIVDSQRPEVSQHVELDLSSEEAVELVEQFLRNELNGENG